MLLKITKVYLLKYTLNCLDCLLEMKFGMVKYNLGPNLKNQFNYYETNSISSQYCIEYWDMNVR